MSDESRRGCGWRTALVLLVVVVVGGVIAYQSYQLGLMREQIAELAAERPPAPPVEPEPPEAERPTPLPPIDFDAWREQWDDWLDEEAWEPLHARIDELRERMERSFEDSFDRLRERFPQLDREVPPVEQPQLDLIEEDDRYLIQIDAPGADEAEFEISLENRVLTIRGVREYVTEETDEGRVLRRERRVGTFQRQQILPGDADPDSIETHYDRGVLTIAIDKVPG